MQHLGLLVGLRHLFQAACIMTEPNRKRDESSHNPAMGRLWHLGGVYTDSGKCTYRPSLCANLCKVFVKQLKVQCVHVCKFKR